MADLVNRKCQELTAHYVNIQSDLGQYRLNPLSAFTVNLSEIFFEMNLAALKQEKKCMSMSALKKLNIGDIECTD